MDVMKNDAYAQSVLKRLEKAINTVEANIAAELGEMNGEQVQQANLFIKEARSEYLDAQQYVTKQLYL
ncbi:hypothetical protein [Alkalicoccobacillus gibsonii]|uniref:hypothetical protein n=1 Tax=Alkalicoccobacillus gibsonii TaxID=79881 RepID=UPI0035190480